jgi:hypothetical protein
MTVIVNLECDVICPTCGRSNGVVWREIEGVAPQAHCIVCGWCELCDSEGQPCAICEAIELAAQRRDGELCQA